MYKYRIVAEDNVPSSSVGYLSAKQFDFPRRNPGKHAYYRVVNEDGWGKRRRIMVFLLDLKILGYVLCYV